jgi:DNA helicase IV
MQQYPSSKVRRILNQPPSPAFYTRDFGKYDTVCAEGMLSDTQRNMAYAELVTLKEMGYKWQDPAPISWVRLLKLAPIQQKQEILQEIAQTERQRQAEQQKQQAFNNALQELAIAKAQSEIAQQQQLAEQQRTAAIENQAETALDRAKTMAEIQDMSAKEGIELIKIAADLEKARIGKNESK